MTRLYAQASLSGATINNYCYNDITNMFGYNGSTYSTVVDFNASAGFEGLGIGSLNVGLSNPGFDDISLTNTSSCRKIGGITVDFLGNLYSNPPASGVYEYIS